MRVTKETLLRIASETAQKRAFSDPGLVAAYLTGSLRTDNPFLGNTTDIDIIFIHSKKPPLVREILALTPEVHLDLIHHPQSDYDKPKELRVHPWLGPELYDPRPLVITRHFFEYVQAGVREKYNEPASILARSRSVATRAREIWTGIQTIPESGPALLLAYLKSINHAANAVSLMANSSPLAERRFLLQFPVLAEAAGKPELAAALLSLLGGENVDIPGMKACLSAWEKDFFSAAVIPGVDARISVPRLVYYKLACESILESESPHAILWPLLLTWTLAARSLPSANQSVWESTFKGLGLAGNGFNDKLADLDDFLDSIEEMLEQLPD